MRRPVQHVDRAGPACIGGQEVAIRPDREIGVTVAIEVARGKRCPEPVTRLQATLGHALDARRVLAPQLVADRGQPRRRPADHVHHAGIGLRAANRLARGADCQVDMTVAVEVRRDRRAHDAPCGRRDHGQGTDDGDAQDQAAR